MPGYLICTLCRGWHICLLTVISFYYLPLSAQRAEIDSLRNKLPSLKDSARIDCLNALGLVYSHLNRDTAHAYAKKAFADASVIGYLHGEGSALNNSARVAGHGFHDFALQEKLSRQAIELLKNNKTDGVLAESYINLALAFFSQNRFGECEKVCLALADLCKNTGNKKGLAETVAILGCINLETGNYGKAFDYFNESLGICKSDNDSYNTSILLAKVGDLYRLAGDDKAALNLYFQSLQYPKGGSLVWYPLVDLGDTYYSPGPLDSLSYAQEEYGQTIKSMTVRSDYLNYQQIRVAEMQIAYKKYDEALTLLTNEQGTLAVRKDENQQMRLLLDMARVYIGKGNYLRAFNYTKELLLRSQSQHARLYTRDGYKLMYMIYDSRQRVDSAYSYFRRYTSMKDSIALDDFSKRLAIYKAAKENETKQSQIELLSKEKLIGEQHLQLIQQQARNDSFVKDILIGGVCTLLLIGFLIFRNVMLKRSNEARDLRQQAVELEMQALRAQMNPHFIFNCLNSINRFIVNADAASAADHLTKFAKLIRLVLQQSGQPFIPLDDELYCLQLYMDLEALRFEYPFSYEIDTNGMDISAIMTPSLLIQPFVENAIWHGLQGRGEKGGKIGICIRSDNNILHCDITDNGVGRAKAPPPGKQEQEPAKRALGIQLTQNRLRLMDNSGDKNIGITIHDLVSETGERTGTRVELKIPVKDT